jgi:hypothetical protein
MIVGTIILVRKDDVPMSSTVLLVLYMGRIVWCTYVTQVSDYTTSHPFVLTTTKINIIKPQ